MNADYNNYWIQAAVCEEHRPFPKLLRTENETGKRHGAGLHQRPLEEPGGLEPAGEGLACRQVHMEHVEMLVPAGGPEHAPHEVFVRHGAGLQEADQGLLDIVQAAVGYQQSGLVVRQPVRLFGDIHLKILASLEGERRHQFFVKFL